MAKQGYKEGSGLGARGQGIAAPIDPKQQHDTRGLGYTTRRGFDAFDDNQGTKAASASTAASPSASSGLGPDFTKARPLLPFPHQNVDAEQEVQKEAKGANPDDAGEATSKSVEHEAVGAEHGAMGAGSGDEAKGAVEETGSANHEKHGGAKGCQSK